MGTQIGRLRMSHCPYQQPPRSRQWARFQLGFPALPAPPGILGPTRERVTAGSPRQVAKLAPGRVPTACRLRARELSYHTLLRRYMPDKGGALKGETCSRPGGGTTGRVWPVNLTMRSWPLPLRQLVSTVPWAGRQGDEKKKHDWRL